MKKFALVFLFAALTGCSLFSPNHKVTFARADTENLQKLMEALEKSAADWDTPPLGCDWTVKLQPTPIPERPFKLVVEGTKNPAWRIIQYLSAYQAEALFLSRVAENLVPETDRLFSCSR